MWGLPKKIKQKKNVLCENSVEVWGNDGSTRCTASESIGSHNIFEVKVT